MEVIKNKRILAIVGLAGLILGCFLPYYVVSFMGYSESVSLWGYWEGKVVFILTLANALFIFQDVIEKYVPQLFNNWLGGIVQKANNPKFALVPTLLVAAFAISLIIRLDVNSNYSKYIKYGVGFWILWVGIVALIGHAIFYKKQNRQLGQPQQPMNYQQPQQPMNYGQPQQPMNYQQPQQPMNYQQPQQPMNYQQPQQSVNNQQVQQPMNYQQPQQPMNYQQPQQPMNYQQPQHPVDNQQGQINPTEKF